MKVDIQYIHMPTSDSLNEIITDKMEKLGKKFNWIIKAAVFLKLEHDASGEGKICEIELSAPGPRIFASSKKDDFEKAVASTIKELEHQLKKRKRVFTKH